MESRVENLRRFEDHFDDMLVAVPPRASSWISREEENVHITAGYLKELARKVSIFLHVSAVRMDAEEAIMTEIYNTWAWTSTTTSPVQLCSQLPAAFQELEIQSILDCGCGTGGGNPPWILSIDAPGIRYLGVDIVNALIADLQTHYTLPTVKFQKMNILRDPPETVDLWFARDFCCLYPKPEIMLFFEKFLESKSPFIAVTSVDTDRTYQKYATGSWIQLNLQRAPLYMPEPLMELEDGEQWFCKKWLYIYNRQQILEWVMESNAEAEEAPLVRDKPDRNAHLVSNIPLKKVSLYAHKG
jgi:trans-aconitate methyltransferase